MKKKRDYALPGCWNRGLKMLIYKKIFMLLFIGVSFSISTSAHAQQKTKVTLDLKDVTLNEVIAEMKKQTDYEFFYNSELAKSKGKISVKAENKDVKKVLDEILPQLGLEYTIQGNLITIREKKAVSQFKVSGKVTDEKGNPFPGVTVIIHGTTQGMGYGYRGTIHYSRKTGRCVRISFILDIKQKSYPLKAKPKINIRLNPTAENIEEVTVVAFGEQKRESVVSAITTR